jgi:hypothetical protein
VVGWALELQRGVRLKLQEMLSEAPSSGASLSLRIKVERNRLTATARCAMNLR